MRSVRFEARSQAGTGWDGVGEGSVSVDRAAPGRITFTERGEWRPVVGPSVVFTNVFRWSQRGDTIRLEHLRFGIDRPVLLFDLVNHPDGVWREASPHVCGDDRYMATLALRPRELLMSWSIRGPKKDETVIYHYQ